MPAPFSHFANESNMRRHQHEGEVLMTISLCMIVKNEAVVLGRCLDSICDLVEEIIIVDTGSTDSTKDIAAKYTDKVLDFMWINDFSAARNFAYSRATMDFQMCLDADDVLPEVEWEKFILLKKALTSKIDMVTARYHTHVDTQGLPLYTSTRVRLTNREKNYEWIDPVHEYIPLSGNIVHSDVAILHLKPKADIVSTRNLDIYEALEQSGKELTPRQLYYFARELKDHRLWRKAASCFERFLDEGQGWYEDNIGACFNLSICYQALNEEEKVLPILLHSLEYDTRAENCCGIGYYFKRKAQYDKALRWFQIAADLGTPDSFGFVIEDYWGYIPNIESCVCCCTLGRYDEAREYNKAAECFKPESAAVKQNWAYLASL